MNKPVPPTKRILALLALFALAAGIRADDATLQSRSQTISERFERELKAALQAAIRDGGPVAAIDVCKDEAPRIASALSRETGAAVRRTSLKYRNPANAPEPWEAEVLRTFDDLENQSAPAESFFQDPVLGARYMRAIETQAVCLACHGTTLAAEVVAAIETAYPHDTARGYEVGDIRGAFSIRWPATGSQN